ncbi:MET2 [Candida pseudojiufengensis]|uniref:MET2 n=1 Tax=Candida pseudojiufengensis TaxID=497109 RepID=UPI0022246A39|nr:MET2 [Candida pseudojiufengensis]KAI5966738.1 MET2 [Candida pseudojiufengensis]
MSITYKDITEEQNQTNPFSKLVPGQTIVEIPEYTLECGETLYNFPVAFKTWGKLNSRGDNTLLICHALTGSSDVQDWWGPLLGDHKTFDPSRFFIICINFLGSPYGSCSPVTIDKSTNKPYGPNFPLVTVKDDLGIQKLILDYLKVKQIACVIGGSMGGMLAMEYSSTYNNTNYLKSVIALATSARASAWCISWNETQRQCIFSDPFYNDGYYYENKEQNLKPDSGLSAARMAALLTYRSRNSFETRFGRNLGKKKITTNTNTSTNKSSTTTPDEIENGIRYPKTKDEENWLLHNEGSKLNNGFKINQDLKLPTYFTAQSYLRYQGSKFIKRFDANCYISITRKLDTHDITRNRIEENNSNIDDNENQEPDSDNNIDSDSDPLPNYLKQLKKPHLIIGIKSDGLFTYGEQKLLGENIPNSNLKKLDSSEGHDAFLLEFELINNYCLEFLKTNLPEFYDDSNTEIFKDWQKYVKDVDNNGESVFGEVEKNITNW